MENRLKVGITHGDINGISYELIVKMMAENRLNEVCTPILYGSSKVAAFYRKTFDIPNFNLSSIQKPEEASDKRSNVVNCIDDEIKVIPGQVAEEADEAALKALKVGLEDFDKGKFEVLTMAPQSHTSFSKEGARDYMEYLTARYASRNTLQLMVGQKMKVGFLTTHIPFKEIYSHITVENIYKKLDVLDRSLRSDFTIRKPRIAVLALNPDLDKNNEEEKNIILPAIEKARDKGIMALGPYLADSLFCGIEYEKFDAILALYHEQGMVPFKAIEGYEGAVLMAGLPGIITTTVNGTAMDIAGKGEAEEAGLRNAVYLGIDVYHNRIQNNELSRNPLPHYDVAGNSNESDMNVEQIAGVKEEF